MDFNLPNGTVTFLFTDIQGSTKLAQDYPEDWERLRSRHHTILQSSMESFNGFVFQIIGDAFCVAFHNAGDALRAAIRAQGDLEMENWGDASLKVRMGIHTGKAEVQKKGDYLGYLSLSRVQRVISVAYGGQILVSNTSAELMRGDLPEGISLLDLKEHRLKGLVNPEHLWQVVAPNLPQEFPPLQSLNEIPNNLPLQLTSFIGREKEIEELQSELQEHRIVTLTGSGGTGKTRLSLQVAAEVLDSFPDGVWFLELASVTDQKIIPSTLANILGLRESAETKQSLSELICGYLAPRKVLVVFDNCEHLIEPSAQFADILLRHCKDLRILASSREALGVAGELAWRVPSLSLPDVNHLPAVEQLSHFEAVRLFIDRAILVQPHFAVTNDNAPSIAQICARLDGIPLAIELAAARANVLTIEQIARRLDDRFRLLTGGARTALPRQQTLRALIDWSYNLLSEEERLFFRRLAVFVGGWTIESAETVCSNDRIDPYGVLDLLAQLVKKSIVVMEEQYGQARYHFLETIRQYAREKLFDTDEVAHLRDRHSAYFRDFADQAYEGLLSPNDLFWLDRLDAEYDNLRAALSWLIESPNADPQHALQLSGALQDYWDTRGYTTEGYQWLFNALNKASDAPTIERCRALLGIGVMHIRLSRFDEAAASLKGAVDLALQLNNTPLMVISKEYAADLDDDDPISRKKSRNEILAIARNTCDPYLVIFAILKSASDATDHPDEALSLFQEGCEIAQKFGNVRLRAWALWTYGISQSNQGNDAQVEPLIQEALQLSRQLKDKHITANCLLSLGRILTQQADYATANRYEEDSLQILRDLSDRSCSARALMWLSWNNFLADRIEQAKAQIEECLAYARSSDKLTLFTVRPLTILGWISLSCNETAKARDCLFQALNAVKGPGAQDIFRFSELLTICLEGVCVLPLLPIHQVAKLWGKAAELRAKKNFPVFPAVQRVLDPLLVRLQAELSTKDMQAAQAIGAALTDEQAIEAAIEILINTGNDPPR